ncbi:hypothetical protein [Collimonas sp.]|uniref:hypothetical protein n=1 Tax=Collimonas sp. TaxID=1963772 RepID=UPI002C8E81E8|nr:hypothetical protein [Collimonas sp.]HWW99633.1 hypothetical protein [Collimonas sp.]
MEVQDIMTIESGTIALLNKSEIEQQVTTAHRFPRSIKKFRDEAMQMVTLTEKVAGECIYSLPRAGKTIEGPSARFAEVIASAWGNSRAGARVVSDQGEFVTTQGVFHDLEKNVAITYEVQRRITDSRGKRYNADMIGVTANAACSIALRNAILKGVPKAFWADMYDAARATVMGDFKTLANRRADAIKAFQSYGVTQEQICSTLGVSGTDDIGLEKLVTLRGILTAIKEGDTTPEQAFANADLPAAPPKMPQSKSAKAAEPANVPESVAPPKTDELPLQEPKNESPLSEAQFDYLKMKLETAALSSNDIQRQFGFAMADITNANFNDVLAWIKNPAA